MRSGGNMKKIYRQGDVLLIRVRKSNSELAEVPRENGKIVLAHGEATGHMHAISAPVDVATLFQAKDSVDRILRAKAQVRLYHDEHDPIDLPAGEYVIRRQREYTPAGLRQVAD